MSSAVRERTLAIPAAHGATLAATEFTTTADADHDTPTVILAHGWTLTRASWAPVVRSLLSDTTIRVIAYDQRGHGQSTWGKTRSASIRDLGQDLATVIEATAPECELVLGGHSMGGMTIMAYAAQHPDAYAQRVRGTVLVSTAASTHDRKGLPGERIVMGVASRAPFGLKAPLPAAVHRRTLFGTNPDKQAVRETTRQISRTRLDTTGRFFGSLMGHDELTTINGLASAPTTVLVGTKDRLTPVRWARELHHGIPDSEFVVVPDKGHMLTYEATDEVTDALRGAIHHPSH